jgi:hypothetical protein
MVMLIHQIHDTSNKSVIDLLAKAFSGIENPLFMKNYHYDYRDNPANVFFILENGRYREGHGKYFVIEEDGKYICSAGWNEYDLEPTIALALTRMYVNTEYRTQYYVGNNILPTILEETASYSRVWITSNSHNKMIYRWFERSAQGKRTSLFNDWPDIYRGFVPIGQHEVYYTMQDVAELKR